MPAGRKTGADTVGNPESGQALVPMEKRLLASNKNGNFPAGDCFELSIDKS